MVAKAWERIRDGAEGPGVGETFLDSLDDQRYSAPARAFQLAEGAVELVELDLLPRLLGIAGSALRLMLRLDEAEHAIHAGLRIYRERKNPSGAAESLQRLAYVVADRGDHRQALHIAEKAVLLHAQTGNLEHVARASVDRGIWLF